ncbi:7292_t:CDS:1, partial [Cetraspora pellucida]
INKSKKHTLSKFDETFESKRCKHEKIQIPKNKYMCIEDLIGIKLLNVDIKRKSKTNLMKCMLSIVNDLTEEVHVCNVKVKKEHDRSEDKILCKVIKIKMVEPECIIVSSESKSDADTENEKEKINNVKNRINEVKHEPIDEKEKKKIEAYQQPLIEYFISQRSYNITCKDYINKFSSAQMEAVYKIFVKHHNVFISGPACCEKSYMFTFIKEFEILLIMDKLLITAPTGIMALMLREI